MKKILALMMAAALSLSVVACIAPAPAPAPTTPEAAAPEAAAPEAAPEAAAPEASGDDAVLRIGFAQIGQESGWRDAETNSIQWYAAQNTDTIDLTFSDAQQKQENQIKAIRTFIQQDMDVIGLAPVVSTGWEAVLQECKDAQIPVIFLDRKAEIADDMYTTFIGSDVILEGVNSGIEMATLLGGKGNVVILEGTVGSSAANDRQTGFMQEMEKYPDIKILATQSGDFTRAGGKEVMESFLKSYPGQINAVFAHNDDMYLGAIEAIKEAGLKPGQDIKSVSCDGVRGIFEAMAAGEANVTVECNPLLGPQFFETAWKIKKGETVDKFIKSVEGVYRQDTAAADLPTRQY